MKKLNLKLMATAFSASLLLSTASTSATAQPSPAVSVPSAVPDEIFSASRSKEVLLVQTLLDRSRHSPGVIDGYMGGNTKRAIAAFERTNGLSADGKIDKKLISKLQQMHSGDVFKRYTISEDDANGPFHPIPDSMVEKAKLDKLAYESPAELLAEKFHMSQEFLKALNPGVDFGKAGTEIIVIASGDGKVGGDVARIEVDKKKSSLRAFDSSGKLLASYPATVGSRTFPSPSGTMEVRAIAPEPKYYFEPSDHEWGPDEKLTLAAGPNNPVGSTWIDLSKDGYGIHGSPDPKLIGKTSSHGCVRLTNWDADALAKAVSQGTKVEFV